LSVYSSGNIKQDRGQWFKPKNACHTGVVPFHKATNTAYLNRKTTRFSEKISRQVPVTSYRSQIGQLDFWLGAPAACVQFCDKYEARNSQFNTPK
jgi:hypothetical protein